MCLVLLFSVNVVRKSIKSYHFTLRKSPQNKRNASIGNKLVLEQEVRVKSPRI